MPAGPRGMWTVAARASPLSVNASSAVKNNDTRPVWRINVRWVVGPGPWLLPPERVDGNVDDHDFEPSAARPPLVFAFIEAKVSSAHVQQESHRR